MDRNEYKEIVKVVETKCPDLQPSAEQDFIKLIENIHRVEQEPGFAKAGKLFWSTLYGASLLFLKKWKIALVTG